MPFNASTNVMRKCATVDAKKQFFRGRNYDGNGFHQPQAQQFIITKSITKSIASTSFDGSPSEDQMVPPRPLMNDNYNQQQIDESFFDNSLEERKRLSIYSLPISVPNRTIENLSTIGEYKLLNEINVEIPKSSLIRGKISVRKDLIDKRKTIACLKLSSVREGGNNTRQAIEKRRASGTFLNESKRKKKCNQSTDVIQMSTDDTRPLVSESMQEMPLKNVDKSIYLGNDKSCPLCKKKCKKMVSHFKRYHASHEVFFSRISSQSVEYISNKDRSFVKYFNGRFQKLKTICVFCGDEKDFGVESWVDHIRGHTGEYAYNCDQCHWSSSYASYHCGQKLKKTERFSLIDDNFYGFRCLDCNYVQLNENNMKSHLKNEHGLMVGIENLYEKFMIIPALHQFPLQNNLNIEFGRGM